MKIQYIIFGVIGLVVLWLLSRMGQQTEPQVVAEFIGSPQAESSGASGADPVIAQERLGVFQTLASLAAEANAAILQRLGISAQLEATRIGADVERFGVATMAGVERFGLATAAETDRFTTRAQAGVALAGIGADRALGERQIEAQENLFLEDLRNRTAQTQMHLSAVQRAAQDFRKQSLERQGTILNAIGQAFGVGRAFDYVSSFGGPRPAPWYEPITKGLGQLISRAGVTVGV